MKADCEKSFVAALLTVVLSAGTVACSTLAPANIDSIESSTEDLFGQVQFGLRLKEIVLLNPYLEAESPRVDEFDAARLELAAAAEHLVDYSIAVIDLARVDSDEEAVAEFVPEIRAIHKGLSELSLFRPHLTGIDIEAIAREAASQPNLVKALGTGAQLHEAAAEAARIVIAETADRFDLAYEETYEKIVDEHAAFMTYLDNLVIRRNRLLDELMLLEGARAGDADSWQALLSGDERLRSQLGNGAELSAATVDEADALLIARLAGLMEIWSHLEPSWTNYRETLKELYEVETSVRNVLRLESYVIESWDKAQRQMVAGQNAGFIAVTKNLAHLVLERAIP